VSFVLSGAYAECRKLALHAECQYAACNYAERHNTECNYDMSVIMLSVEVPEHQR
jgi:hypothetical protein